MKLPRRFTEMELFALPQYILREFENDLRPNIRTKENRIDLCFGLPRSATTSNNFVAAISRFKKTCNIKKHMQETI
jgi:predicted nucleic acid-binding protein